MARLLYQGHGSFRLTTAAGAVVYVDPFAGEGYDRPADIILVTHEHGDHNAVFLVPKKPETVIFRSSDMHTGREYKTKTVLDVTVTAVPAYNRNHPADQCVGYMVEADGLRLYFAGDTSKTEEMGRMRSLNLDYAFLPTDGVYNMSAQEAAECAELIGARHTVPVHTKPGALFDEEVALCMIHRSRMILKPGTETEL